MGFLDRLGKREPTLDELLESFLLVQVPGDAPSDPEGWHVIEPGEELALVVAQDDDGLLVLPVFTSEQELRRWNAEGTRYAALPGKILVELLAESEWDRMVVNPAGPNWLAVTREDARRVLGVERVVIEKETTMLVGAPAQQPPQEMVDALRTACAGEPRVSEAYLYQVAYLEHDEPPHLALGLRFDEPRDEADAERVAFSILRALRPEQWGYDSLDAQLLDDELLELARGTGPAAYERAGFR